MPLFKLAGATGTVTSVGLTAPSSILAVTGSPITTAGVLALALVTQAANLVWAGPATGVPADPTFRALVAADIPDLSGVYQPLNAKLTAISALANAAGVLTNNGSGVFSYTTPSTGTVTSVALSAPSIFTVSGSPVTTSGTLGFTLNTQTANLVFAGPGSGGAATPTFRALVALDIPDLSAIYQPLNAKLTAISALANASGVLTNNGSGVFSYTTPATGTVTSVAMTVPSFLSVAGSPVTTTGTLAVTLATQAANTHFAGPTTGGAATPTFRALVAADFPSIPATTFTMATARILGRTTAGTGAVEELTAGTSLSLGSGALNTIQGIRTTDTPQFARQGLGMAASASYALSIGSGSTYELIYDNSNATFPRTLIVGDSPDTQFAFNGQLQARRTAGNPTIRATTIGSHQGYLAFDRFNGSIGALTSIQSGQVFGSMLGLSTSDTGTTLAHGPEIAFEATENWSSGHLGSAIRFYGIQIAGSTQTTLAFWSLDGSILNSPLLAGVTSLDGDVTGVTGVPKLATVANNGAADSFVNVATNNTSVGAHMYGFKTRSTFPNSDANTALVSGDEVLTVGGFGADGAAYRFAGGYRVTVDGTPSSSCPGRLEFLTGGATIRATISNAGGVRFHAYGAGTLTTDASGNITAVSDIRLKENLLPFTRGLSEILKIDPISYHWNKNSGFDREAIYAGFSAQNVRSFIPEAVGRMDDGILTLQDRPILAALVNAVKELSGRIDLLT